MTSAQDEGRTRRSAAVGDSGIGREGGSFSREFFTEPKAVIAEIS